MANWAYVENNIVQELYSDLPKSWRNISGLNLSEDNTVFLNSIGWYKVIKEYQDYDTTAFDIAGYNYSFQRDKVIESYNLILKPDPLTPEQIQENFLVELRRIRDIKLRDSDWTQLADVQVLFSDEQKNKWYNYRQELRDLPEQCIVNNISYLADVIWPEVK